MIDFILFWFGVAATFFAIIAIGYAITVIIEEKNKTMDFQLVRKFLESWGLGFDTPEGISSTVPYPAVYQRIRDDAFAQYGSKFSKFVGRITDTTDSETYLTPETWEEVERAWEEYNG